MKAALSVLITLSLAWIGCFPALSQTPTPTSTETALPTPTRTPIVGDLNGDGFVGVEDQLLLQANWHKGDESVTATPTLALVTLPPGSFEMGNTGSMRDTQYGLPDEYPRHTVTINYPFQMGKYEVTNVQYAEVFNWAKGRGYLRNSNNQPYNGGDVYFNGQILLDADWEYCDLSYNESQFVSKTRNAESMANHPVKGVTWYGSVAFCNWLSEKEERSPAYDLSTWSLANRQGGGYRLPSESEWEYACRGSASNPYRYAPFSFGDDTNLDLYSCNARSFLHHYMVWCGNDDGWTEAVGSKEPNDYQLHDMHGNMWEWCQDWWHADYTGAPNDGRAWEPPASSDRVVRGGGWNYFARNCRSADRGWGNPLSGYYYIGLRVVVSSAP